MKYQNLNFQTIKKTILKNTGKLNKKKIFYRNPLQILCFEIND